MSAATSSSSRSAVRFDSSSHRGITDEEDTAAIVLYSLTLAVFVVASPDGWINLYCWCSSWSRSTQGPGFKFGCILHKGASIYDVRNILALFDPSPYHILKSADFVPCLLFGDPLPVRTSYMEAPSASLLHSHGWTYSTREWRIWQYSLIF